MVMANAHEVASIVVALAVCLSWSMYSVALWHRSPSSLDALRAEAASPHVLTIPATGPKLLHNCSFLKLRKQAP